MTSMNRRSFLYGLSSTLGTVAFNSLLQAEQSTSNQEANPFAPRPPHYPAKAKRCIFLYMEGGPSHIDTFDPKPRLNQLDGQTFRRQGELNSAMSSGNRRYVGSPFGFRQVGQSGLWMCDRFVHLPQVADDLCVYRGCVGESVNHPTANLHMNTGNRFGGDPAIGSWVSYGLGTENQNLPSFFVLPDVYYPQGGTANWSNGFLPAHFQGTPLRSSGSPILNLNPPEGVTREVERENLNLLSQLERGHQERHPNHRVLAARMNSYELAFRMQTAVPDLINIDNEPAATKSLYGIDEPATDAFGRRCLLARKLVESGVRFVQVYSVGWDSHDRLERAHGARIRSIVKPMTALILDLKRRGLLEETLIVWGGEFGRSPDNGSNRGRVGRDHNATAMSILLAGGGVKTGHAIGATDDIGHRSVEVSHPIKDLHVTLLHLLGLDDNRLTYFHAGRFKQLSQTGGEVIREVIA